MTNETITQQLFKLTTQIKLFDKDNFQRRILDEIVTIFGFEAALYVNVLDYDSLFLSELVLKNSGILEDSAHEFFSNELFAWAIEDGPYIGTFQDFSVIGVKFQQQTWGLFFAAKHPLPTDIKALKTFAKSVSIWFDYPYMFHSTEPPIKVDMHSERKYKALQTLYSIAEWDWHIDNNDCVISDAFIAFFDHAQIKPCYDIRDLYHLIGPDNKARFKECIDKVVRTEYQVFEEFKCPQLDGVTYQHIQMLFDPIYEDGKLTRILGFCRDNGRTYASDDQQLHWFDSDWLHDLPVLPLEWIVHSDQECEITTSSFHHKQMKEDVQPLISELSTQLTGLFKKESFAGQVNISVKFPFSNYHYQLIASQSHLDPLLWRGFLILLEEKVSDGSAAAMLIQRYEDAQHYRATNLFQALSSMEDFSTFRGLIQYLKGLPRLQTQAYEFEDFWRQLNQVMLDQYPHAKLKKNLNENVRLPYAQWALSLVPYIINFFKLDDMGLTIQITEPAIVESQNQRLVEANHVIEVSFSSTNARPCHEFEAVLFQYAFVGTSVDVSFISNEKDWRCRLFFEVRVPEQPILMHSQNVYQPVEDARKKTVLIVDDDEYNTQTLEVLFHSDGFRTITATHGQHAIRLIDSLDIIDIIILDIRMPVLDGFGVLEYLQEADLLNKFPIMMLSANITPDVAERLRKYNVDAIVEKPFDMDELVGRVNRLITTPSMVA